MSGRFRQWDNPQPEPDGRMFAPAAGRNIDPILATLTKLHLPQGRALEIASGTGEHTARLADAFPGLQWQPTEIDQARMASIRAWVAHAGQPNLLPPVEMDATKPGWSLKHGPRDLIYLVNLLHLIPAPAATTLLSELKQALAPDGMALLYGPFLRDGLPTSEGDARFHASLRAADPAIGYKDLNWVIASLKPRDVSVIDMPANNLLLVVT